MSTAIEWTDETWNPTLGCSKVSPGCDNCYAIRVAARGMSPEHRGLTKGGDWTGEVRCLPERLNTPLRWRKPRRVFVDSMSDLFHPQVPDDFIARVFATMALAYRHTFQVLTKRPSRMAKLLAGWPGSNGFFRAKVEGLVQADLARAAGVEDGPSWVDEIAVPFPLPNVWLGTSVEDQHQADRRIPHLLATPAAVRFLSCEPLLGPIDFEQHFETFAPEDDALPIGIDWCIVGGESGPGARPMHPDWARGLRDQCVTAGVPFHFKQWGRWVRGWTPMSDDEAERLQAVAVQLDGSITPWNQEPLDSSAATMIPVGKKAAGRVLDGRTWDQYPDVASVPA